MLGRINKAGRLGTIYCFGEIIVQEGILDIELMNRPWRWCGNAQHSTSRSRLDHKAKVLTIINTRLLRTPSNDPSCLVFGQCSIGMIFDSEYPLVADHIHSCRPINKTPRIVSHQSITFVSHCIVPIRILEGKTIGMWDWGDGRGGCQVEVAFRYKNSGFGMGLHMMLSWTG